MNQDKETTCRSTVGTPTERAVLERNWLQARRTLLQCRATMHGFTFKDEKITSMLGSIAATLAAMGCDE